MKRQLPIWILAGALACFVFGLYHLFRLRYETGDIYPEYSSLRADPLGTMALFEALDEMPGISLERDYSTDNQLPRGRDIAYLHLAASREDWMAMDPLLLSEVDAFVSAGGRLVISFLEDQSPWATPSPTPPPPPPGKKSAAKKSPQQQRQLRRASPHIAWGFDFSRMPLSRGASGSYEPVTVKLNGDLPLAPTLAWHSPIVFTNLSSAWQTIYSRKEHPVLIERKMGLGSIVMATDSFFLSNEALLRDRQPELLAWVVGSGRKVFFDEAHLGIVEESGITILMHKYNLHAFGLALLLLAALFIWKNATSFPPAAATSNAQGPLTGKEAAAGFNNLLRRNIAPADLLRLCFDEWTKSLGQTRSVPIDRIDAAQGVLEAENNRARTSRDPVRAYRDIALVLKGGKR